MAQDTRADEEQNTRRRANLLRVRYFDTRTLNKLPLFPGILTNQEMYANKAVILSQDKGKMIVAITVNSPQHALPELKSRFLDYRLSFVMISESGFREFMLKYDPPDKVEYQDIDIKPDHEQESIEDVTKTLGTVRSDDIFNYLVRQAVKLGASDIHLETQEHEVRIRFRVDGVLHEIAQVSYEKHRQLNSTLAVHANISTSSKDAQTGHMSHTILDDDNNSLGAVNMRIETVPTTFGQDAVIRLFNIEEEMLELGRLGLSEQERAIIDEIVAHPTGLVMSVGPTGSGKTTTLYSILRKLNTPGRKIITLEDPVEYTLPGVVQIPVDTEHKESFANKLRAVLRLDPDVIMIGEIRDVDTARTALQASLSGHLVLSTFHAADSVAALARLYEFIGDNPLLTSAIRLVIAQRLVRRLDEDSRVEDQPDEHIAAQVRRILETLPEENRPDLESTKFYKPGKSESAPFGYVGQTAVVELLQIAPALEKLLHSQGSEVDLSELRMLAQNNGMATLLQNALLKAVRGETSLEEVFRVVA